MDKQDILLREPQLWVPWPLMITVGLVAFHMHAFFEIMFFIFLKSLVYSL